MAFRPRSTDEMLNKLNTKKDLGLTKPFLSAVFLREEYEKDYGICNHDPNGSRLQSVAMMAAEKVEPNSQLYSYINRFIDLRVDQTVPNITLSEFLSFPRDIVEELLRKCRNKLELEHKLAEDARRKAEFARSKERIKRKRDD